MTKDKYSASRAFVQEMRALVAKRDLASIQQAVQRMRDWLCQHPDDTVVSTALEEFDILEEAARIVAERNNRRSTSVTEQVA